MAAHEDASLPAPRQPEQDAYLAACSDLLMSIAMQWHLEPSSVDALLDAMPDAETRENLRVGLIETDLVQGPRR